MDGGNYDVEIDEGSGYVVQHQTSHAYQSGSVNQIVFHDQTNFQGSIDNIYLVNAQDIYTGGSADHFTFSGFDPALNNYIVFNNNRIEFNDCPAADLTDPLNPIFYQLQQEIDPNIHSTTLDEKYRVIFEYDFSGVDGGGVNGYFYNSNGDGFMLDPFNISGDGTYNVMHTIETPTNPIPSYYLRNTLVIFSAPNVFVGETVTNGFIDNIRFRQEFITGNEETVSFSENVRGWVSRKSFVPEQGVSLSSSYFTFKTGQIYEHNIEDQPRNNFYGVQHETTITAMLNESPSVIKSFNALNYEGTQSNVDQFKTYTDPDGNSWNTLSNYNLNDKKGWKVNYIKTDKQEGFVKEFIEKEGKWFNYIKGNDAVNTSDLSFQGLGTIKEVS